MSKLTSKGRRVIKEKKAEPGYPGSINSNIDLIKILNQYRIYDAKDNVKRQFVKDYIEQHKIKIKNFNSIPDSYFYHPFTSICRLNILGYELDEDSQKFVDNKIKLLQQFEKPKSKRKVKVNPARLFKEKASAFVSELDYQVDNMLINSKYDFDWSKTKVFIHKLEESYELRQLAFRLTSAGNRDFEIPDSLAFMMNHSPTRLDQFFIEMHHIPNYLHVHFRTHGKFAEHFVTTGREDRSDKDNEDRWSPKDHGIFTNAQEIMQISRMRMCEKADNNAQFILNVWKHLLITLSPHLAMHMIPKCVYRNGICDEGKMTCGKLRAVMNRNKEYFNLFNDKNIISVYHDYKSQI